jgi:hypothetical protein
MILTSSGMPDPWSGRWLRPWLVLSFSIRSDARHPAQEGKQGREA